MKKPVSIVILCVFLFQIAYLSYYLPQIILLDQDFPPGIKLSTVIAGLCLGILLFLKDPPKPPE
ncbi:hypothetical protein KKA14_07880 [bacterium]|nr:hypothetical protein [bacterium]